MLNAEFNKETFKNSVKENVKMLYRKNLEEASQQEIYQAVCYAVKDVIIDNWSPFSFVLASSRKFLPRQ